MLPITPLLVRAQFALKLTQEGLGELAGVSRRTVTRWTNGGAPSDAQLANIVRALLDVDLELANALAASRGQTLASLGLEDPTPPPAAAPTPQVASAPPALPARCLADSIVCAAIEAGSLTPSQVRPILRAAFARAAELGTAMSTVIEGLTD